MKLRDKDTKKYLLTVFVATFVAYIIPAVVLYLGHFMGIMLTICISLVVTNGAALSLSLMVFVWLGIFNLLPICIHYAIYSFISKRTNSKKERPI